jgi:hypothetical protein
VTGGYLLNIGLYAQQDAEHKNKVVEEMRSSLEKDTFKLGTFG